MRLICFLCSILLLLLLPLIFSVPGPAQPLAGVGINWMVKSRFRLFKDEDDFNYLAKFHSDGGVLAEETALAAATNGAGWAAQIVARSRLCIGVDGGLDDTCSRDYLGPDGSSHETTSESYLNPADHKIEVEPQGTLPGGTLCTWKLVTESTAIIKRDQPCGKEVFDVPYGRTTQVQLFVATHPENSRPTATTNVKVRDILIAGLGDSTAAGEGDPDRPILLSEEGFCFHRAFSSIRQYWRPSRRNYNGRRACVESGEPDLLSWSRLGALWMNRACHRSLYSYQVRVALELAIENKHIAVTYIPLGCSGATIDAGMLGGQYARESNCTPGSTRCSRSVGGQIEYLRQILNRAHQRDINRDLDLVLLTVGANDIRFSGLAANVMIDPRSLIKRTSIISTVDRARQALNGLPSAFGRLRDGLKPLVGTKLERVLYVSYGHPALYNNGQPCPTTLQGFDVHPAFKIDGDILKMTSDFVTNEFFPRLKALATCSSGGGCRASDEDRMTFVDGHQVSFRNHGFCAQANDDPAFDRACFTANGHSFETDLTRADRKPLTCSLPATLFRAYASRQRWIRTANDSYFTAMTYPDTLSPVLQPVDIHDALWGVLSAVDGGALHPTAQGYAAMADAALPAARRLLGLTTAISGTGSQ
jgi:hypothetical protein